ncbi:hypothetical protein [Actinophytocola oryzae]|uniref:PPE family protein n=1 Tax=Actinophytocola oryzae TaxID=502181 RepID=A0A4R7VDS6_9PSEU|nr:hypothetical protein [Actinophytocola oryzae]TDV47158.1 hypothetical protein CLV71_110342 [Actinophytocola oryzae]
MGNTGDQYVSGGVNWSAFTLEELVGMVSDKASVPQLERLADDWRETGDGVTAAADYLADALDDLMNFWSGESADQARNTVALNAQWVGDLGTTARDMGGPIDEAAGALKSAQDAMPRLPATPPQAVPGSAPLGAEAASSATDGSPLGAAVGATAAGSESAFQAQAEQEEMKRVAVETMQRFEAAAVGIDQATPQFQGQSTVLRPREDESTTTPGGDQWLGQVNATNGVDPRWQLLTGMTDTSASAARRAAVPDDFGGFSVGGGTVGGDGGAGVMAPVAGRDGAGSPERLGGVSGRPGVPIPTAASGVVTPPHPSTPGMTGPIGAPVTGGGMGAMGAAAGQQHRRRVPFDGEDPFDTGEKASKPVIGL